MRRKKKLLPLWLLVVIDISLITAYTLGFYLTYYVNPRQLESSNIKTSYEETSEISTEAETETEKEIKTEVEGETEVEVETDGEGGSEDATMKTYTAQEFDADQAIKDGAWQAWCFGPALLEETGERKTSFTTRGRLQSENPRSAIGYYEPGHYCFVVVDGRQNGYSAGMTLSQLSTLFEELGCNAAYNMDGGKSSSMAFDDTLVNQPNDGGREVSDCILIKEVAE